MPLVYGEGRKAFTRLQEEIIRTSIDHSIFAWEAVDRMSESSDLLASSPSAFARASNMIEWSAFQSPRRSYTLSNRGLEVRILILRKMLENDDEIYYYGILQCCYEGNFLGPIALRLKPVDNDWWQKNRGKNEADPLELYQDQRESIGHRRTTVVSLEMVREAR